MKPTSIWNRPVITSGSTRFRNNLWSVMRLLRVLGIGAMAGVVAGLVAGGLGSRVAMRVSAIATGPSCLRLVTENGIRCGEITLDGTLLFGALVAGPAGGFLYVALRSWLAKLGRWRGFTFGLLLLATFGFLVIEGGNRDFRRFGTPVLNIIMFAALFPLFGVLVAPLMDRLDRFIPALPPHRPLQMRTLSAYAVVMIALVPALVFVLDVMMEPLISGLRFSPDDLFFLYLMVAVPGARWLLTRLARGPLSDQRTLAAVGYAFVAVPILVGLMFTIRAMLEILRA